MDLNSKLFAWWWLRSLRHRADTSLLFTTFHSLWSSFAVESFSLPAPLPWRPSIDPIPASQGANAAIAVGKTRGKNNHKHRLAASLALARHARAKRFIESSQSTHPPGTQISIKSQQHLLQWPWWLFWEDSRRDNRVFVLAKCCWGNKGHVLTCQRSG